MNCYRCEKELTKKNVSEEHIFLNSIGGKLKSMNLLCYDCNSKFGDSFDKELAKQLLFLSSFLNVERDRGEHPVLKGAKTESGEEIYLLSGGKPYYSKPHVDIITEDGKIVLDIKARDKKELKQIAKGLNRKYPQIDIEDILQNAVVTTDYLKEPIKVTQTIGGEKALNAIVKIALNYCIYITKDFSFLKHIIDILKNGTKNELCKHYYPNKLYKKEKEEICHLIHIQSNKKNKNIIAYVEFFSSYSFLILLSNNYTGKNIKSTYCFDLNHKKVLSKTIDLKLSTLNFENLSVISPNDYNTITEKMDRVVRIGLQKQTRKELSDLISQCVDDIFAKKYGHEPIITQQMTNELSTHIAFEFVKFITRDK